MTTTSPESHHHNNPINNLLRSAATAFLSLLPPKPPPSPSPLSAFRSKIFIPFSFSPSHLISPLNRFSTAGDDNDGGGSSVSSSSAAGEGNSMMAVSPVFAAKSAVLEGGGPAFVGDVFAMCDVKSGSLMATYDDYDLPFLPGRAAEFVKKVIRGIVKSDDHHIFRFFMDLSDAVSYVKRLNPPGGIVGACSLNIAYRYFKEQSHSHHFQFVANKKQVKAANKLLKELPIGEASKTIDGVPVFSAQNLDVIIASRNGINRYTPFFFNKEELDSILEESADRHFHSMIEFRHSQRIQEVRDDGLPVEAIEESGDDIWEHTEVDELLDAIEPGVLFSAVSKIFQMQIMHAVDKVLLGNRWLRKATGIQPKFPYVVDSFEKRTAASIAKASQALQEMRQKLAAPIQSLKQEAEDGSEAGSVQPPDFRFPFGDWSKHPPSILFDEQRNLVGSRTMGLKGGKNDKQRGVPLPKVTIIGMPDSEEGDETTKKMVEKLKGELNQESPFYGSDHQDPAYPLFVANVDNIYPDIGEMKFGSKGLRGKHLKKEA
ncbi:hypothetical protein Droror1_Dr00009485 [Drosera rotundifolia]